MGFLLAGKPLTWKQTSKLLEEIIPEEAKKSKSHNTSTDINTNTDTGKKKHDTDKKNQDDNNKNEYKEQIRAYVRKHGIIQFVNIWNKNKDREDLDFLWGDEVEGFLVVTSSDNGMEGKSVKLNLRGSKILELLEKDGQEAKTKAEEKAECASCPPSVIFHPEYGSFMIETTPSGPYGGYTRDLRCVEANMRLRRDKIKKFLKKDEIYSTMTTYPLMGVNNFTAPHYEPTGPVALSSYVPDQIINPHPRFATLTKNIRTRRGSKVDIRVPLFMDKNNSPADGNEIHMDAMGFGMGCCCLQTTFLARNLEEARDLYDHLAVLGPIMLSLTAATPFFKGQVAETDVRWSVISQSVDDRTPEERGLAGEPLKHAILKSRYDSISCYIAEENSGYFKPKYNDLNIKFDHYTYDYLLSKGVDKVLAKHVAHLWIRDPLVIYEKRINIDDKTEVDHFENIQSTNWQSVRFKPPPTKDIGWRVEFRTMEVQITDFENAAFTVFIALLSRAILAFSLNLYIPISEVDKNMKTAHNRNSVLNDTFHWRNDVGANVEHHMKACGFGSVVERARAWSKEREQREEKKKKQQQQQQQSDDGDGGEGPRSEGYLRSVIEVNEDQFSKDTLSQFLRVKAKHRFVIVYGEVDSEKGCSWCPGCTRALPIVEKKLSTFKADSALLKLPVSAKTYCGNKQHPYRLDDRLGANSVPCLIRVDEKGLFDLPLDSKWASDSFVVNQYMSKSPKRRLRGASTKDALPRIDSVTDNSVKMTIEQIMLNDGKDGRNLGLIHIVSAYLDMIECDSQTRKMVDRYLGLIKDRAQGKLMTAASWLRRYVDLHPQYKKDARLNEDIVHDLLKTCDGLTDGQIAAPQLLGDYANTRCKNLKDRGGEVIHVKGADLEVDLEACKEKGQVFVAMRSPTNAIAGGKPRVMTTETKTETKTETTQ